MNSLNNKHQIKTLLFDIIFDDERRAAELYDDVKQLHYQQLEQILQECLDEFAPLGTFAQIPQLELDLGEIRYEDLETELPQRIFKALLKQLREVFHGENQQINPVIAKYQSELSLLEHFLRRGHLSWNIQETPSSLLLKLFNEKPSELRTLIIRLGQAEQIRKRLVYRFNDVEIHKLVELLLPKDHTMVFQFQKLLLQVLLKQPQLRPRKTQIEKEVWFFLLSYMLLHEKSAFNFSNLIRHTLIQLGGHFEMSFSLLINGLSAFLDQEGAMGHTALKMRVQQLSAQLRLNTNGQRGGRKKLVSLAKEEQMELIFQFLRDQAIPIPLTDSSIATLQSCLLTWLDQDPKFVIQILRQQDNPKPLLQALVREFHEKTVLQLIQQLEPSHHKSIQQYHGNLIAIHQRTPIAPTSEKELSQGIWGLILQILLFSTGSYFNQKAFLKHLIQQLAGHYNISYLNMIHQLFAATQALSFSSDRVHSIMNLIKDLHQEENGVAKDFQTENQRDLAAPHLTGINRNKVEVGTLLNDTGKSFSEHSVIEQRSIILYFLRKGLQYLPIPGLNFDLFQKTLKRELLQFPEEFVNALRQASNKRASISKIVHQFDTATLHLLIQAIVPNQQQHIIGFQRQVLIIQQKEPILKTSKEELSHSLWELILHILLNNAGSQFNQQVFLKSLIKQIAAHYNIDYADLVMQLYRAAKKLVKRSSIFPGFINLLASIHDEFTSNRKPDTPKKPLDFLTEIQWLQKEAESILCGRRESHSASSKAILHRYFLQFSHDAQLRLTKLWQQKKLKPAIFDGLSNDTFFQLIRVLQPAQASQWIQVLLETDNWFNHYPGLFPNKKEFSRAVRQNFYQKLFIAQQGRTLSSKTFVAELIQALAKDFQLNSQQQHELISRSLGVSTIAASETKPANASIGRLSLSLCAMLLDPSNTNPNWYEFGVRDRSDAIRHLVIYQQATLLRQLYQSPITWQRSFVAALPTEAFEALIRASKATYKMHLLHLIQGLNQRLHEMGFGKRQQLVLEIKQISFLYLLQQEGQITGLFLQQLEKLLLRYALPTAFFEQPLNWKMPANGSLERSIAELEQRLQQEHQHDLSQRSPAQRYLRKLLKEGEKRSEGIPYFKDKSNAIGQEIFVANAGLIIINAYIPYFFERCGLLENQQFASREMQERAVLLLQYVFQPDEPIVEEDLVLNKLLCGLPIDEVIPTVFSPTEQEKETVNQLLAAIIGHWEIISNSTPQGFRESWLWREGKLVQKEKAWELTVEQKAFDVLLDYIPFTLSPASASWMEKGINVHWR